MRDDPEIAEPNMAREIFRLADQAHREVTELRGTADALDREAERLTAVAAALADGRSIAEALLP